MLEPSSSELIYLVKDSGIHGKGLFAARNIKQGDIIGSIKYNPVNEPINNEGPYVLWLDQDIAIQVDCELKYINHCSSPNACYCDDLDVIALKNISIGEEITHDYGDDWE